MPSFASITPLSLGRIVRHTASGADDTASKFSTASTLVMSCVSYRWPLAKHATRRVVLVPKLSAPNTFAGSTREQRPQRRGTLSSQQMYHLDLLQTRHDQPMAGGSRNVVSISFLADATSNYGTEDEDPKQVFLCIAGTSDYSYVVDSRPDFCETNIALPSAISFYRTLLASNNSHPSSQNKFPQQIPP